MSNGDLDVLKAKLSKPEIDILRDIRKGTDLVRGLQDSRPSSSDRGLTLGEPFKGKSISAAYTAAVASPKRSGTGANGDPRSPRPTQKDRGLASATPKPKSKLRQREFNAIGDYFGKTGNRSF